MITNEERLALVLEANDKASAVLEKVRKQLKDTGAAAGAGSKHTRGLNDEFDRLSDHKILKGARAMQSVARAAEEAKFGSKEAVRAMGELAETAALASGNAKFAGWAIGLNAAVVAGGALLGILEKAQNADPLGPEVIGRINKLTKLRADQQATGLQKASNEALAAVEKERYAWDKLWNGTGKQEFWRNLVDALNMSSPTRRRAQTLLETRERTIARDVETSGAERVRITGLSDQTKEIDRQRGVELALGEARIRNLRHQESSLGLQREEAMAAKLNADAQVDAMFRVRDADGQLHKLTAEELAMKGQLLQRNRQLFSQQLESAQVTYDNRVSDDAFQQKQSIWYARRKLTQSDFQNSLDDARRSYETQMHTLEKSGLLAKDLKAEQDRITQAYGLQVGSIQRQHDLQIAEEEYRQRQTVFYARRRLTQNDFQNSLDDATRSYDEQLHALELQKLSAVELKRQQDKITEAYQLQLDLLNQQHEAQTRRLRSQNNVESASATGNVYDEYKAKLEAIEEERVAAIKAGEDVVEANRRAEIEKRKLQRDTIEQTKRNYKTVEDVLLASNSRQVKAVGHAVQTIRRLEIGVEGSKAAVKALREGAEALASFAHGDFAGGGLHLASAAQFAATAALAAQESLGGGRTASGGGGGGGVAGSGTFEPRDNGVGGSQSVYLITRDAYGRDQIQRLAWELDRAGVMKRPPTQIPPTLGFEAA